MNTAKCSATDFMLMTKDLREMTSYCVQRKGCFGCFYNSPHGCAFKHRKDKLAYWQATKRFALRHDGLSS